MVSLVRVGTDSGDIFVTSAPDLPGIEVQATIHGSRTEIERRVVDGVLELEQTCASWIGVCRVDWFVAVPRREGLAFELSAGSGNIEADEVFGELSAEVGSGNVTITEGTSPRVNLASGSGNVAVRQGNIGRLVGHTGSGNIGVDLVAPTAWVELDTGSGNVDVGLPAGAYVLDLDTGSGNISTSGVVSYRNAGQTVLISTGSGNIDLRGRH